jgi:exopolyphosphatase/guanosine-5'-triphosphate,3'-diphosphate pyrophosphatase
MQPKRIAAIDLGTNSFHLVIVELKDINHLHSIEEIESKGNFEVLYRQREVVRINVGRNNQTNILTEEGISRAIKVLKEFKEKIDEFGAVTHAIATSAIREAENREEFIKYVRENLGIEIKVVSGYEEARLIYLGVLQGLNLYNQQILLIDIGGGSTELLVGKFGKILYAASFKLGAVRLTQMFFDGGRNFSSEKKSECEKYIKEILSKELKPFKQIGFENVIGTSGEIQAIARLLYLNEKEKGEFKQFHGVDFTAKQFQKISKVIFGAETLEELKAIKSLDEKRAEIIVPGTLILKVILEKLEIDKVTVSGFALREGIIIDAIEKFYLKDAKLESYPEIDAVERAERLNSIQELAKSYNVDLVHSNQVKKIALKIFDELKEYHKLDSRARELLEFAAILHDIGYFISAKQHHKNSYLIIKNSELVGFTENEIEIIANIARYHRKALPKERHKNFKKLSDEDKKFVKVLAAILRLSDGLEKTHSALINDIKVFPDGNKKEITMVLRYLTHPPEIELWAAERRKKVLENLFDVKINLRLERLSY